MPGFETLRKRRDFLAAARAQKSVSKGLILQRRRRRDGELVPDRPRFGFTASKKVGGAVLRNRAKRRLRALVRESLVPLADPQSDYVLIARAGATVERDFALLREDLASALSRVDMPR